MCEGVGLCINNRDRSASLLDRRRSYYIRFGSGGNNI